MEVAAISSLRWQLHSVRIISQHLRLYETAQHHALPTPIIDAHLDKEAAPIPWPVVEVDAAFPILAVGQVTAVAQHPAELHY